MPSSIKINNYKELLRFIERDDLSKEDVSRIFTQALKVLILDKDKTKVQLIEDYKQYVKRNNETGCKGIFLGLPSLDVE